MDDNQRQPLQSGEQSTDGTTQESVLKFNGAKIAVLVMVLAVLGAAAITALVMGLDPIDELLAPAPPPLTDTDAGQGLPEVTPGPR